MKKSILAVLAITMFSATMAMADGPELYTPGCERPAAKDRNSLAICKLSAVQIWEMS